MIDEDLMEIRAEIEDNHTIPELKRILEDELGQEYEREIQSQRNDLIQSFFRKVGEEPREVTLELGDRTYNDLLQANGRRHALATSLNHYLANRGIRARTPTEGLSKGVLSSMITAIRTSESKHEDI